MSWRPFEQSRETVKAAAERNRCNLHDDCEAADEKVKAKGGRVTRDGTVMYAYHCTIDDCEDCLAADLVRQLLMT